MQRPLVMHLPLFSMTPEQMAALHARAFNGLGRAWSAQEFKDLMRSENVFAIGDTMAFALGRVVAGETELLTIATAPQHRRQGLALGILSQFEAYATKHGAERSFLEVAEDNGAAIALYEAHGYRSIARREGYYNRQDGSRCDALIFEKRLV